MWIYRASKLTKDGKRIYAKNYGKRAFPIWIDEEEPEEANKQD